MKKFLILAGALMLSHAAYAETAGKVIFVAGSAKIADAPAKLDGAVEEGQLLSTGADGYIYIKTIDNGLFILRPNTQARIANYHVDNANPANTRIKLELLSGVARSQSGQAVKLARQNFRFNTPVAAIGVRGTDFTVFTDQDTSRVTVLSGGITMSGFAGACRPEGSGPCEGNTARELSAAQKGQLLQLQRGQAAPQLVQGNALLAPDTVAPPHGNEPGAAAPVDPSLDPKKSLSLQEKASQVKTPPVDETKTTNNALPPPVVVVPTEPVVPPTPALPPREVSWGRWSTIAGESSPNTGLSKAGAERIAVNEDYVLFRSTQGAKFATPQQGTAGFNMASGEGYIHDIGSSAKSPVALSRGWLSLNFDEGSFYTMLVATTQSQESFNLGSRGKISADGLFSSVNRNLPDANMTVNGVITDANGASYIFQASPDSKRVINGVTVWKK